MLDRYLETRRESKPIIKPILMKKVINSKPKVQKVEKKGKRFEEIKQSRYEMYRTVKNSSYERPSDSSKILQKDSNKHTQPSQIQKRVNKGDPSQWDNNMLIRTSNLSSLSPIRKGLKANIG